MMMRVTLVVLAMVFGLACGDTNDGEAADGSGGSCGGLCGCPEAATLDYEATVWNPQLDAPVVGAEVTCLGEDMPITTSDDAGTIAFIIDTEYQPGCGYLRCNNIEITADGQGLAPLQVPVESTNGERIDMSYLPD